MTKANNSFAVEIPSRATDPNLFYKKELLALIASKYPEFSVSGKNPPVIARGVEYASHGNLLTFGTSKTHDVEWVERPTYACEKGYSPIFDLVKDWNKIVNKIADLHEERYPSRLRISNGMEVEFFKNFVKIGYERVPYNEVGNFRAIPNLAAMFNIVLTKADIEALYYSTR